MISQEEYNNYKHWIVTVEQTGSSILPWIENPHDVDYIFYVNDMDRIDLMIELLKHKPHGECWFIDSAHKNETAKYHAYQQIFRKHIYGRLRSAFDIFQNIVAYKHELVSYGLQEPFSPQYKKWYHILTGIYLIQNESYELTSEQKHNIQMCHDNRMTPELFEWIQEQLQQFKIDIENK